MTDAATLGEATAGEKREEDEEEACKSRVDVVVPFKIALDGEIRAQMTQALAQYLLYLRGQIPCVYEEFHALVRRRQEEEEAARAEVGSRKRKLVHGGEKKARRLIDQAEQTLGRGLLQLCQRRVSTVAMVFGASVASPREVWQLEFGDLGQPHEGVAAPVKSKEGTTLSRERIERLCVQKLIRLVLSYATQLISTPLSATSLHLLVYCEKTDAVVDGFVPKQALRLRLPKPKKGKRTHVIQLQGETM